MTRRLYVIFSTMIIILSCTSSALSFGEDVLAHTGQYTFFIKPDPCSNVTYYQKMVPCILKEEILVPKKVSQTYPVPVPAVVKQPVTITETPIGCAQGASECIECRPVPTSKSAMKDIIMPRPIPVAVPTLDFAPKTVIRKIMLPQWFEVTEHPKAPIRKIR